MKQRIKAFAIRCPVIFNTLWRIVYPAFRREELHVGDDYGDDRRETFATIFEENRWLSNESRSGEGSSLAQTILLRRKLPGLLRDVGATTLLDAPCGDFNWMRTVQLPETCSYIGGEIVPALVERLASEYSNPNRRFVQMDIVSGPLPNVDVWLCRDVLFHLSEADIRAALKNFAQSQSKYILTTTYDFVTVNRDICSGGFRFINLRRPPFNFGPPRRSIDDYLAPEPPRILGLWSKQDVITSLRRSPTGSLNSAIA